MDKWDEMMEGEAGALNLEKGTLSQGIQMTLEARKGKETFSPEAFRRKQPY